MVIARQRRIHFGVFAALAATGFLLFGVDPNETPLAVRYLWRPVMVAGLLLMVGVIAGFARSRGRLLVGGADWIAEYEMFKPSPTRNRVVVGDKASLRLVIQPLRSTLGADQTKQWVELVVTTADGSELVHCSVNSKLLAVGYQENFEAWKQLK